jgi:hypothetical protein
MSFLGFVHRYNIILSVVFSSRLAATMAGHGILDSGVTSLAFSTFTVCVRAYEIVTTAQRIGTDGRLVETMFLWEHQRLISWAQRAGLDSEPIPRLNWSFDFTAAILDLRTAHLGGKAQTEVQT